MTAGLGTEILFVMLSVLFNDGSFPSIHEFPQLVVQPLCFLNPNTTHYNIKKQMENLCQFCFYSGVTIILKQFAIG